MPEQYELSPAGEKRTREFRRLMDEAMSVVHLWAQRERATAAERERKLVEAEKIAAERERIARLTNVLERDNRTSRRTAPAPRSANVREPHARSSAIAPRRAPNLPGDGERIEPICL